MVAWKSIRFFRLMVLWTFFYPSESTLCRLDMQVRVKLGIVYNADQTAEKGT